VIAARVTAVRERLTRAAARAGRDPSDVRLVAVSKTHPAEAVRQAWDAGLRDFGENKVQEAEGKIAALSDLRSTSRWHLIGHLQGNKVRKAAGLFDCVHSIDDSDIALRLDRAAGEAGRTVDGLVQVDLAAQAGKFGMAEEQLGPALERMRGCAALRVVGLMGFPPYEDVPERTRGFFARLRELRDTMAERGLLQGRELSMGMSHDLEVAVEEGSTMVRIGTALFGERPRPAGGL